MNGLTRVVLWELEARKRRRTFLSSSTCTSNVKYFFRFLMIMTRKGSLMPSVFCGSDGHVMNVVEMFVDMISSTLDWMSLSVMRLMWPFMTFLSQICSGLLPIEYRIDKKPDWKVFLNMAPPVGVGWLCRPRSDPAL